MLVFVGKYTYKNNLATPMEFLLLSMTVVMGKYNGLNILSTQQRVVIAVNDCLYGVVTAMNDCICGNI